MSAPKPSGIKAPLTSEDVGRFWERPPSFSFIAAKGDVAKGRALLAEATWQRRRERPRPTQ